MKNHDRQAFELAHETALREAINEAVAQFITRVKSQQAFENRQAFEEAHESSQKRSR